MLPGISLTSLLLLLLLLLLLNSDVACFTTHKFNLSYNKSGCCRLLILLQKAENTYVYILQQNLYILRVLSAQSKLASKQVT